VKYEPEPDFATEPVLVKYEPEPVLVKFEPEPVLASDSFLVKYEPESEEDDIKEEDPLAGY